MKKVLLKNAKLVLENKLINGSILIFENKIEKIFIDNNNLSELTFDKVIDLEGKYLGPAFIDIHIHGADGADVMDSSEEALRKISSYLVQEGTANFLATTLTSSKEILKVVANLQNKDIEGANIFGVHMEGPYFSIEYKGAQNDKYMLPANIKELEEYLSVKEGLVKLFSISPHNQENLEAIKYLVDKGVITSVGHSAASYEAVMKAVDYGLSHATHTYNGMKGFTHREPGVVGAIFNSDNIMAEIIFDKIHVHPEAVRTLIRVKGVDKIVCVTDSMSATGLAEGQYKLGELDVNVKDGQARLASNNALAGSVLRMDIAFKNLIELGYSITDAFKMTSTNAAKEFKLNTGILKEGKDADLVVLDKDYKVCMTVVKGKIKFINL